MPNYCNYEMKIVGSKKAINRVIKCLEAEYDYGTGTKPEHKHFFRVFEANYGEPVLNKDGTYTMFVSGDCAWSVYSCMCKGEHTYYSAMKEQYPKIFNGTTIQEQSKGCDIEIFSEEEGCEFSEHYLFKDGKVVIDKCVDVTYETNEDGEVISEDNPNRNKNGEYRWIL